MLLEEILTPVNFKRTRQKVTEFSLQSTSIILKQLKTGNIKYGRQHLDFQNGSLFFVAPNQLSKIETPELSECQYNWGVFFYPDLILSTL